MLLRRHYEEAERRDVSGTTTRRSLDDRVAEARAREAARAEALAELGGELERLGRELNRRDAELERLGGELSAARGELERRGEDVARLTRENEALRGELERLLAVPDEAPVLELSPSPEAPSAPTGVPSAEGEPNPAPAAAGAAEGNVAGERRPSKRR
ncbi:MAG: hypothetical protein DIU78_009835 [Pseudomonadota bacterium]